MPTRRICKSLFHKIDHDVDCCTAVRQFALAEKNAFVVLFLFYFRTLLGNTWASPESLLSGRPAPVGGAVLHKLMRKAQVAEYTCCFAVAKSPSL